MHSPSRCSSTGPVSSRCRSRRSSRRCRAASGCSRRTTIRSARRRPPAPSRRWRRSRSTTRGDTVFQRSLQALKDLWTALDTNGDTAGTLAGLGSARDDLSTERASVGARQAELVSRTSQVKSLTVDQQKVLSDAQDADLVAVIARLTQTQTALQATLTAGAEIAQTSLVDLLRL